MKFKKIKTIGSVVCVAAAIGLANPSVEAVSSAGGTSCAPSGSKGCFARGTLAGGLYILDFTWAQTSSSPLVYDTAPAFMNNYTFAGGSGQTTKFFDLWRNRLATGSRSLFIYDNAVGGSACIKLKYDTRTWVNQPNGSANYARTAANSASSGAYGTCIAA
jgi:hypothetical protein